MAGCEDDDLASLDFKTINEGAVVELIRRRYSNDKIYTAVGDILLAVNPFKSLPIYGTEVIQAYQSSPADRQLSPHVYSKCKAVLKSMCHSSKSQCCVLTGDSASGKTESLKHFLGYIVNVVVPTQASLKSKFLQVQFILEAFGNAVTVHNSNSSRFAMYYEVYFSPEFKLSGGKIHHYMLEKSRIVHQEKGGKNFHIFHYLLYGLDADQLQEYSLSSDYPHRYLSYDPSVSPEDIASKEALSGRYSQLLNYMESVGFKNEEIINIVKCLASVLHIGNIAFGATNQQTNSAFVKDPQPVHCASSLLGVSADDLGEALITGTAYQKGVKVSIQKTVNLAAEGRDNLARTLYSRLFSWLVLKVNSCLKERAGGEENRHSVGPSVGLLDVFGFEKFEINGLEQLCINTANEQLAYFYNQRVFIWEQEELESEGLRNPKISFYDNKKTVDLLLYPPQGLLPVLDEESKTAQATDAAFVKKCDNIHRKHPNYDMAKLSYPAFTIRHYTGTVTYVTLGFLNSNREMLGASLQECMQGNSNEFICKLFKAKISGTGSLALQPERLSAVPNILMQKKKNKKNPTIRHKAAVVKHLASTENQQAEQGFHTVGSQFRTSIAELMEKVLSCEVHFVRCIKPNWYQSPDRFDPDAVLAQVRSLAVVQTVQIRSLGFPVWFSFDAFIKRFGVVTGLLPNAHVKDMNQTCQKVLRQLADPRGWKIGKTKVFLTYWCLERLNLFLVRLGAVAVVIQKVFRGWRARSFYSRLKRLKMVQENTVKSFLDVISSGSDLIFEHNSNQVTEEDAKQKLRLTEQANVQKQAWSPNVLNQKSPSASSQPTGFDDIDSPDGFPPTSPRPKSPQKKVSNVSLGSISDLFGPESPTRPGPPRSRVSDLSIMSIESTFSVDSEDFDAAPQVWCKITCFERESPRGEFFIDRPSIVIDGSSNAFDVTRIGLGALPPSSDPKVTKVRSYVGKGVEVVNDEEGNIWATRGSKNNIFVKGHFLSDEVIDLKGVLEKDATLQVFDWESFAVTVRHYCSQTKNFDASIETSILSSASIYFSFVKDGEDDVDTPCWVQLDVLQAVEQGKAACKYARDKKLQEKQKMLNSLPAILRPKTKNAREMAAVAHFQQQIRPRRFVDTDKFNRKQWARTEVAMNPFLYGKKEELTMVRQSPLKALQTKDKDDPGECFDGASPMPQSLSDAFGNSSDVTDAGPGQMSETNLDFAQGIVNVSQNQETRNTVVTSTSGLEKPKKVWAKKKVADDKAEKAKKRSSSKFK
ncbi:hypothetical protein ACROYT_G031796 [Oculina patagonica]